ncbi:hypothetical protein Nepgr_015272 [Nepenthes gracilis]|uniref:Bifunctional inhibitor/plant lipid transfer protein/seed storage helical domain-containing protein n=1 Tax=Nepenthes gracilis TaxID=150966 RepID=A0AAD3SMZ0_NEPGR|nr:hypothetical protein Nepgr_015272 [Nepenthes gracilis]
MLQRLLASLKIRMHFFYINSIPGVAASQTHQPSETHHSAEWSDILASYSSHIQPMEGSASKFELVAFCLLVVVTSTDVIMMAKGLSVCGLTKEDLDACKPSVRLVSPVPPTPTCCNAIAGADLQCLCAYRKSTILPALGINPTEAANLPAKCNINPAFACEEHN